MRALKSDKTCKHTFSNNDDRVVVLFALLEVDRRREEPLVLSIDVAETIVASSCLLELIDRDTVPWRQDCDMWRLHGSPRHNQRQLSIKCTRWLLLVGLGRLRSTFARLCVRRLKNRKGVVGVGVGGGVVGVSNQTHQLSVQIHLYSFVHRQRSRHSRLVADVMLDLAQHSKK